ncbi:MAG: dipeptide/oligopeptide/nickel ABC transporter permease/ATP-binding protein [Deltaproteobacteria bacterium]|jgi:peptide/nickel transport system permease protein|nr:dipeptide/oligopeptide/nickel ABC transporter permease/ATP-binding protein [Deltaproteobacteria bacterium]
MTKVLIKRILRRKSAIAGLFIIIVFVLAGIFAPLIAPHDPIAVDVTKKLLDSSREYPMGTDQLGRCVFSRVLWGIRPCLGTGILVTFAIMIIGVPLGLLSGYLGGFVDNLIMRAVDIATTFPSTLLALALVGIYKPSLFLIVVVFICLWWAPFARLVRGMVIKVKEQDFVLAAESGGSSRVSIILGHITPNVLSPIIIYATLRVAAVIAHVASFSFIGLGSQPPTPDWGVMLNDGRQFITNHPMLLVWPGLAIVISVLAFNLFGEGLGEALTPDPEDKAAVKEDAPKTADSGGRATEGELTEGELTGEEDSGPDAEPLPESLPAAANETAREARVFSFPAGADVAAVAGKEEPAKPLLRVRDLKVEFKTGGKVVTALDGVNLEARKGSITALVGGSGSGKSVMAQAVLGLVERPGKVVGGSVEFDGENILGYSEKQLRKYRRGKVAMIFQDPGNSMNPVSKVKKHLLEAAHTLTGEKEEAMEEFRRVLERVGLKNPDQILESYPFELSGGMCQRVMVAMGLVSKCELLIADEPTSSLDLTTQAAILEQFAKIREEGLSIVLITHDLGVVAQTADTVYVIHDGKIQEHGPVADVFARPKKSYTKSLMASVREANEKNEFGLGQHG